MMARPTRPIETPPPGRMVGPGHEAAARELSWFAIRQPAVIHFLERRLWSPDGDAFAVALDAACRLHDALTVDQGIEPLRVSDTLLRSGYELEPPTSLIAWLDELLTAAPVMLTPGETRLVQRALGAVAWALTTARGTVAGLGDQVLR